MAKRYDRTTGVSVLTQKVACCRRTRTWPVGWKHWMVGLAVRAGYSLDIFARLFYVRHLIAALLDGAFAGIVGGKR